MRFKVELTTTTETFYIVDEDTGEKFTAEVYMTTEDNWEGDYDITDDNFDDVEDNSNLYWEIVKAIKKVR